MVSKQKALDIMLKTPYKLGHMLGFKKLGKLHNEWIISMLRGTEDESLQSHRGSYKTTCVSIALALIIILLPKLKTLFIRKTDTDVKEVIKQVYKILESSHIKALAFAIYGIELSITKYSATEISTNLSTDIKGTSQLVAMGINGSLTGKHFDRIFTDDIINNKDRRSKAERENTKAVYQELQNVKNRGGRIYNTGTPWHKDDAFTLMPKPKVYDCYTTGLIERKELEEIRKTMTPSLFAANYELKHIADADALFTNPNFTDKAENIYNGICHIDAAYGGGDSTAFTIVKQEGSNFYVFGKKFDKHVDDCLSEIYKLVEHYRAGTIHCENNGDKGYLKKEIEKVKGYGMVSDYHESMNKYIKISTYLRRDWENIYFIEDTDPEYINQILDYTEQAEHDDCPDSLASILREFNSDDWLY